MLVQFARLGDIGGGDRDGPLDASRGLAFAGPTLDAVVIERGKQARRAVLIAEHGQRLVAAGRQARWRKKLAQRAAAASTGARVAAHDRLDRSQRRW